ncbi:MAG: DUF2178 domain-containing protein [archaeon]|nr:DUF2178 domain-containing protein [archaeon]
MKIRTDRDILRSFGISLGMILLGIVMCLFLHPHAMGLGFILGGLIILVAGFYTAAKPKIDIMMDERYTRINEKAGHGAFQITILMLVILWLADIFLRLSIEYKEVYSLIICIGLVSHFILRAYYNKKGEEIKS